LPLPHCRAATIRRYATALATEENGAVIQQRSSVSTIVVQYTAVPTFIANIIDDAAAYALLDVTPLFFFFRQMPMMLMLASPLYDTPRFRRRYAMRGRADMSYIFAEYLPMLMRRQSCAIRYTCYFTRCSSFS